MLGSGQIQAGFNQNLRISQAKAVGYVLSSLLCARRGTGY